MIERLTDDRWAVLVKAHHSMVDGISGIALFEALCDQPTSVNDVALAVVMSAFRSVLLRRGKS